MELKNATIIVLDEIELLATKEPIKVNNFNDVTFNVNWCRLKENVEELICLNRSDDKLSKEIKEKNIRVIDIRDIIKNQVHVILEKEISSFIGKNINNISYFFERQECFDANGEKYYTNPSFLTISSMGINPLEENTDIETLAKRLTSYDDYSKINTARIKYKSDRYETDSITVDLRKMKILTEPSEICVMAYNNDVLKRILAYKQYQLGITPKFYNEIAKINKFLKGKKNVLVTLKNGYEIKVEADIDNIIDFYDGEFSLRYYGLKFDDKDNKDLNINNLYSIKHGKNELFINNENLKPLKEQLKEIIQSEQNGIICDIHDEKLETENKEI